MNFEGFAPVWAVTIICYLIGEAVKRSPISNDNIPVICGVAGGILGALGLMFMPEFPMPDIMSAIAVGIVSGFAATGVNQVYQQTIKKS